MRRFMLACCTLSLAGCALAPTDACQLQHPPDAARIRVTHGVSLATFPGRIPPAYTGCQRTWLGDERDPAGMQVLATSHFAAGRVVRFEGAGPGGPAYDCRYVEGRLDAPSSANAGRCPLSATDIEEAGRW